MGKQLTHNICKTYIQYLNQSHNYSREVDVANNLETNYTNEIGSGSKSAKHNLKQLKEYLINNGW